MAKKETKIDKKSYGFSALDIARALTERVEACQANAKKLIGESVKGGADAEMLFKEAQEWLDESRALMAICRKADDLLQDYVIEKGRFDKNVA